MAAFSDMIAVHEDIEYIGTLTSSITCCQSAEMHILHEQYPNDISLKQRLPIVLTSIQISLSQAEGCRSTYVCSHTELQAVTLADGSLPDQ